jgi:hypothetical protein
MSLFTVKSWYEDAERGMEFDAMSPLSAAMQWVNAHSGLDDLGVDLVADVYDKTEHRRNVFRIIRAGGEYGTIAISVTEG